MFLPTFKPQLARRMALLHGPDSFKNISPVNPKPPYKTLHPEKADVGFRPQGFTGFRVLVQLFRMVFWLRRFQNRLRVQGLSLQGVGDREE